MAAGSSGDPGHDHTLVGLRAVLEIEVIDLSQRGLLLTCACRLQVGHRMPVHMVLGREPFMAWIEVTRVEEARVRGKWDQSRYLAGAIFTSLDERSKRTLDKFLPREPQLNPLPRRM
jgi:hypothetical protein